MKTDDFRKGKRGPVLPVPPGKERITIRLDADILEYFRNAVERAGGGNYQTLINNALRAYIEGAQKPTIEETLRQFLEQLGRPAAGERPGREVYIALGRGEARPQKLAEGEFTAPVLIELAASQGVDMPVSRAVAAILSGALTIDEAIESLLTRPFKAEG